MVYTTLEKMNKPSKGRITTQQSRLAHVVAEEIKSPKGLTKAEMAQAAGYSSLTARAQTSRMFTSDGFKAALTKLGVTEEKIADTFRDAMQAKTVVTYKGDAFESDIPDHRLRMQAADKMSEITGMKTRHVKIESVNLSLTKDDVDEMLG